MKSTRIAAGVNIILQQMLIKGKKKKKAEGCLLKPVKL